ncbi:ClpXP protease specificity-enhancing factor [Fulvimonas soli]|jgi:stringent starvation protein B|uniref:Stringent starvation protein B n=1 Tax=Fulvimonas soli TaxID=155197 RepID=A0A316IYC7_9GAMM|nr:ClpXP protease specificity-enhancing factor [Fulvimonas soli]PWK92195.1 stringent starvation protein B [Fulvimonas soli]TNY27914.1 ClpXP protease specificity-enhancing factor [Fulvimonas soli]
MSQDAPAMTPNRPYLLRAIYDWISDNNLTPYLLVDAGVEGVQVPPQAVRNGQVVLNLAMRAVANLDLGNEWISFQARFSGVSHNIRIPVRAVLALYAQENGQGMMFPAEDDGTPPSSPPPPTDGTPPAASGDGGDKPRRGTPHLRIVK